MKEQFIAQVKQGRFKDKWINASSFMGGKKYLSTAKEALDAIDRFINEYPNEAHEKKSSLNGIGIGCYVDKETAHKLAVTDWRIRVRLVTEWQDIETGDCEQ